MRLPQFSGGRTLDSLPYRLRTLLVAATFKMDSVIVNDFAVFFKKPVPGVDFAYLSLQVHGLRDQTPEATKKRNEKKKK